MTIDPEVPYATVCAMEQQAYRRGLVEGRANPWRPMSEIEHIGHAQIVLLADGMYGYATSVQWADHITPVPSDIGWLPLPTVPT